MDKKMDFFVVVCLLITHTQTFKPKILDDNGDDN